MNSEQQNATRHSIPRPAAFQGWKTPLESSCRAMKRHQRNPVFDVHRYGGKMRKRSYSDDAFKEAVKSARSVAGVIKRIGLTINGGNYRTVHMLVDRFKLDTSHWTGHAYRKGSRTATVPPWPLKTILIRGSTYHINRLRERLIGEGVMRARCSGCFRSRWHGRALPLELHHVDGDRTNNELSNLRILCPNCHSLTHNWKGRATRGKSRSEI